MNELYSRRNSKDSVSSDEGLLSRPVMGSPLQTGQTDRLLSRMKKIKVDLIARRHGGLSAEDAHTEPRLAVLDAVQDWTHVKDSKTGETWFYNTETYEVAWEKPFCMASVQEASVRRMYLIARAACVLKTYLPKERTRDHLVQLSVLLRGCALLQQFDNENLQDACKFMRLQRNGPNEPIMWQGEYADTFYVVIRGKVGVWAQSTEADAPQFQKKICKKTGGPIGTVKVEVLGDGEGFGEAALLYDQSRQTSVITEDHCEFAVVERQYFREVLKDHFIKAEKKRCIFLEKNLPVTLGELRIRSFEELECFFKETPTFDEGTKLCESGEMKGTLDMIYEGSCKVLNEKGEMLWELGEGQLIGVHSVLMTKAEPYRVVCSSPVKLLHMTREDALNQLPRVVRAILVDQWQERLQKYADLEKRAQVCSVVSDLSSVLLREAGSRRNSLAGEDGDNLSGLTGIEGKDSSLSDSDSDMLSSDNEEPVLDGLQRKLRLMRRHSLDSRVTTSTPTYISAFSMPDLPDKRRLQPKPPNNPPSRRRNSWGGVNFARPITPVQDIPRPGGDSPGKIVRRNLTSLPHRNSNPV